MTTVFDAEPVDPSLHGLLVAAGLDGGPAGPAASRLSAPTGLLAPFTVPLPLPSALHLSNPRSLSVPNASIALCSLTSDLSRLSVSLSVCMCVQMSPAESRSTQKVSIV